MDILRVKGNNDTLWLLFHGTGGNKTSLLYIVGELDTKASILAFEGNVGVGKARRFFEPLTDGKVDWYALNQRIDDFLAILDEEDLPCYKTINVLGYSNGANFIISLLQKRPNLANNVYLLHPSELGWHNKGPIDNQNWFITMGANDQLAPAGPILQWINKMSDSEQSRIHTKLLDTYHAITDSEIEWLQSTIKN